MQYTWAAMGGSNLVRRKSGSTLMTSLFSLADAGNVVATTDHTGAVDLRFSYDAYGQHQTLNSGFTPISESDWNVLFKSKQLDQQTPLVQYRSSKTRRRASTK